MKLLVGNPGKIDGHIPPDEIPGIRPESYDTVCYATRDKERSKPCDGYMIDGKEIHLFNITGNRNFLFLVFYAVFGFPKPNCKFFNSFKEHIFFLPSGSI